MLARASNTKYRTSDKYPLLAAMNSAVAAFDWASQQASVNGIAHCDRDGTYGIWLIHLGTLLHQLFHTHPLPSGGSLNDQWRPCFA